MARVRPHDGERSGRRQTPSGANAGGVPNSVQNTEFSVVTRVRVEWPAAARAWRLTVVSAASPAEQALSGGRRVRGRVPCGTGISTGMGRLRGAYVPAIEEQR
jgi:hypothetical protein